MSGGNARVLITGVSRFLGLRVAKALEQDDRVEKIVGVDLEDPPVPIKNIEFIRADISSPLIARVIDGTNVDTIIHTNIASSPRRFGGRSRMKENNVMGTLQLFAAAQRARGIRKVVMKSSTAVYGSSPAEPSLIPEDHAARQVDLSGYGKDCADAETYARDFGRRRGDVELVVLRTQNVIGPTAQTNITEYLSLPVVPTAIGFDPRLQFLHEQDAVAALVEAALREVRGIFNVAADGVVYLSQALRLLGKPQMPLLLPLGRAAGGALRRAGAVDFSLEQLKLLLYGRVVSTRRAKEAFGFTPQYTSNGCVKDFRDHRVEDNPPGTVAHPAWERELFELLNAKASAAKEPL